MRGATLIVLAWNKWPLTRLCLESLLASELDQATVIVVDNGSRDETASALDAYADRVRIVRLPENLGFVRGMNAGIAAAAPEDDIVLLNNDLDFTQHDWLNRLRDAAYAAPDHGIVGCRLLGPAPGQRLFHLGGFIEPEQLWGQQSESGQQELDVAQFIRTRRVQGIAFAVAYLRRDCIERIGVLDEIFHSYFEDTDYCLRAADAGIASVVAGAVTLRHDQHGSTSNDGGFRERLWKESRANFAARWQQRLRDRYRGTLLWQGCSRSPFAYVQLTRALLWRLDARNLRMGYTASSPEYPASEDFRLELATRRSLSPMPEAVLVCAPGTTQAIAQGRHRVALAFSEWTTLPANHVDYYNRFDLVIVPDAFQKQVFDAAGITAPIEIVALGSDREYCHPGIPTPRHPKGHFVFLCFAEELERDAPMLVAQAFLAAFSADDPVELIIRISPGDDEMLLRESLETLAATNTRATIRILAGHGFPYQQRSQWLGAADVYVSARRGAGWDPLVRDAIACGRIVIAPAYGSQRELVQQWANPLPIRGEVEDSRAPGQRWADPDPHALQQVLHEIFEQQSAFRGRARANGARFTNEQHFDDGADRLVDLITRGAKFAPPPATPAAHRPTDHGMRASGQIIVLGMHRSGTSSVGGLLALLGAWPGPEERLLRGPDNPKGHYEHADLHMACVRRLAAANGDWRNPAHESPVAAIDAFRRETAAILETLEPRRPWFIKEPRLCLLAQELLPQLTHPVFVHVTRSVFDVADSLERRDRMPQDEAFALWKSYTSAAFAASEGWPRVFIDYDALISDPFGTTRRLYDDLCASGIQGLSMPTIDAIREWIEPNHREPGPADVISVQSPAQP